MCVFHNSAMVLLQNCSFQPTQSSPAALPHPVRFLIIQFGEIVFFQEKVISSEKPETRESPLS